MSVSGPPAGTLPEVRHGTQKSRSGAWVGVGVGLGLGLGLGLPAPPSVPKVHHPVTLTLLAVQVTLSLSLTLLMVQVRDHSSTELDRTRCTHATQARGRATPARTPELRHARMCSLAGVVCTTVRW